MSHLAEKNCVPCRGGSSPMGADDISRMLGQLGQGWTVERGHHLRKEYKFTDFASALRFVNQVSEVAEQQGHHPDVYLSWGKVRLEIWTHKINGLTESDFIFAAKADQCLQAG